MKRPAADPLPRHCARCGRGLTQRTRWAGTPEERLAVALFAPVNLLRGLCAACGPVVAERSLS